MVAFGLGVEQSGRVIVSRVVGIRDVRIDSISATSKTSHCLRLVVILLPNLEGAFPNSQETKAQNKGQLESRRNKK